MGKFFPNFVDFRPDNSHTISLIRVPCIIIMVIFFGDGKINWRFNCCHDFVVKDWLHFRNLLLGNHFLFRTSRHNATAILCSNIITLSVELRWVMDSEKDVQDCFVSDD